MRKLYNLTQEDVATKIGVTRQAVAKWESGDTMPDLEKTRLLAELFGVSIDNLANYEPADNMGVESPPKGKHLFGMVTVGDKGQIVIPAKARKLFEITPGDQLVVLGDEGNGMALMKAENFMAIVNEARDTAK